jgi:mannose-1-phosphate guanylyltransferase/mannose-6-phosphate isomerase
MAEAQHLTPVILCGGSGTRLWPLSRERRPKQMLAFMGEDSLFQATLSRISGAAFGMPIIVTGADHRFLVKEQLAAMGCCAMILVEPMRRDSAAAIAVAALLANETAPQSPMIVLAADHAVPDVDSFQSHVMLGAAAATAGRIVTFGIRPDHPATGYGYIRPGPAIENLPGVHEVSAFVEKPDQTLAARYCAEGYLWNSGNFMALPQTFLDELARHAPDVLHPCRAALDAARREGGFTRLDADAFAKARAQSIDYALMEKTSRAAVIPSTFQWSDIGSWAAVQALLPHDGAGNSAIGDAAFEASRNCFIHSTDRLTAIVGLEEVIVVTTPDAVLVTAAATSERVKGLVEQLKARSRRELISVHPGPAPREDGTSGGHVAATLEEAPGYRVRRIRLEPGATYARLGEGAGLGHWIIASGLARVTTDEGAREFATGASFSAASGAPLTLENPGPERLEVIEIITGLAPIGIADAKGT